jgi:hypothetical protein
VVLVQLEVTGRDAALVAMVSTVMLVNFRGQKVKLWRTVQNSCAMHAFYNLFDGIVTY